MIITIDGPAGSGKSSVAKRLAKELNIYYLNTGLLYRAIAYIWLQSGLKLQKIDKIYGKDLVFIKNIKYRYIENSPNVFYGDENITTLLSNHAVSQAASILSAKKEVRAKLLDLQRSIAKKHNIVADGRDCGSVVFPKANYKFYLTARLDVRAKRIFDDESRGSKGLTYEKVKAELDQRDDRDQKRKVAPLIIPKNAIIIDNSDLDLDQTILHFLSKIQV